MKAQLLQIAVLATSYSMSALADSDVNSIFTNGEGRYEKNTNYFLFVSGKSYQARIPRSISEGQTIVVSYDDDGNSKSDEFEVHRISNRDDLCRLHNKIASRYETFPGDIIYIRPCRIER